MSRNLHLFINRPLVFAVVVAVMLATVPQVVAETISVRGPDGNTISINEDSVAGDFEGLEYYADDDTATVNGQDGDDGGGGGGGNAGVVIAVVAVVAIAAGVGVWWYVKKHNAKTADNNQVRDYLVQHELNDSASIAVSPRMMQVAGVAAEDLPDLDFKDFASADVSFRLRF